MNSIRTRLTVLTLAAIIIAVSIAAVIGVISVKNLGQSDAEQMLALMCETGQKNLDSYFESVEQSVETVATLVQEDLSELEADQLAEHMERMRTLFARVAYQTHGVLTYYYRIDPTVSDTVKGFWYTNIDGEGFKEHEPTDISQYDMDDTTQLVWFTVPRDTGKSIWLPPYITDNLDVRVISYNIPVYWNDEFLGVIGIEIDYSTMAQEVDHIRLYESGYAFLNDAEGNIIYHPYIDSATLTAENAPKVPEGLLSDSHLVRYRYEGVEKMGVWRPLSNGMRLNVTAPVSEINSRWYDLIWKILIASVAVLLIIGLLNLRFTGRLIKPLRDLTKAAEMVDAGEYDFILDYDGNDELGVLTRTFNHLVDHLKDQLSDLNRRVFVDPLTLVRNKGAFTNYVQALQDRMDESAEPLEFAVGVFDCDDLKSINDRWGHDKGDLYLKASSRLICKVFQHSPVFRIGGDEFAVILEDEDFREREELVRWFEQREKEICASQKDQWERVRVSLGMAIHDPETDKTVIDTVRRADRKMYENKRLHKSEYM